MKIVISLFCGSSPFYCSSQFQSHASHFSRSFLHVSVHISNSTPFNCSGQSQSHNSGSDPNTRPFRYVLKICLSSRVLVSTLLNINCFVLKEYSSQNACWVHIKDLTYFRIFPKFLVLIQFG